MKNVTKIAHPLKTRTGLSQGNRAKESLMTDTAPVDGKDLADRLYLISEYARQVNFYSYQKDEAGNEFQETDNWTAFFRESLPFQLAVLSKISMDDLEGQFQLLSAELQKNPSPQTLQSLLDFVYNKLILPVSELFESVEAAANSFGISLLSVIKSSYMEPLKSFIRLYNAGTVYLCVPRQNFTSFMESPWQLGIEEVYALDPCIKQVKKGKKEAFLKAGVILSNLFSQVLAGFGDIVEEAPGHIEESLMPLEESLRKKHQPHLALLFTFLELFKYFQGDINKLTKKHLDFFYQEVLKITPRDAVPDKAHIIFEVARHLDEYPLPEGLLLKDGKDANNEDILFGLDHEIILDKAEIKDLRTLSLLLISGDENGDYIEGVYIAPVANSADGQGEKFKKEQSVNWPTLGAKYSKFFKEDNALPEEHPKARLGFVLSSPVLLLEEGKRTITIWLDCDAIDGGTNLVDVADKLKTVLPLFHAKFSGEKEWIEAIPTVTIHVPPAAPPGTIRFQLEITLGPEIPAVTFYNEEALEEKIDLKKSFPLVKIELNKDIEISWRPEKKPEAEHCCLRKKPGDRKETSISPYHFLQQLKLVDANIEVEVCGVKNLIVQNDENLQDVNKPVYPFGARPKVGDNWFVDGGADFYIGSREIFCKDWQKLWINAEWKDKPSDLHEYYRFYRDPEFENGDEGITEFSFRFLTSILHQGEWIKDTVNTSNAPSPAPDDATAPVYERNYLPEYQEGEFMPLFPENKELNNPCGDIPDTDISTYSYSIEDDFFKDNGDGYVYEPKSMPFEPLQPLTVNTRKGFIKLTLAGTSFQHDRFTYVLTRQMMALADLVDPQAIADSLIELKATKKLSSRANDMVDNILAQIQELIDDVLDPLKAQIGSDILINSIKNRASRTVNFINNAKGHLPGNPGDADDDLDDALSVINALITDLGNLGDSENLPTVHGRINKGLSIANTIKDEITKSATAPIFILPPFNSDNIYGGYIDDFLDDMGLKQVMVNIASKVNFVLEKFDTTTQMGLPKEPYTPLIKSLSIDYQAKADLQDIDIIHLYPYENTSKYEDITKAPTLFPFFDDEGTLFIGIENLSPGGQLSMLFQLAEATADSEQDRAKVEWYYLSDNHWEKLRPDFEIISDETDGLTVSGIVTIAIPDAIGKTGHTIMPEGLYWIKSVASKNVAAVAETIGIHLQAAKTSARFSEKNDKNRLDTALEAGSIAKLAESDFSVKKVEQPYPSFGGRKPEMSGHFYVRVSEHLKHKGRVVNSGDCEKIVLEAFPEIYKVKCISHTMGLSANIYRRDLEVAPGYAVVAVIPDLTRLRSGSRSEPKAPISLLEKVAGHLRKGMSPFARLKVMNPRYEHIDIHIAVKLHKGRSAGFYAKKLKEDLTLFMAPWYLGDSEKIAFGQEVYFSDIVGLVERLDYIDYIRDLELNGECNQKGEVIKPLTARSVLTGGEIHVCIVKEKCEEHEERVINELL